jgi:hypothetical protein
MRNFLRAIAKQLTLGCTFSCLLSLAPPSQDVPLLKRIRDYWNEKDFTSAKKQISLYLSKHANDPVNEELHMLLGDLYLEEGNFPLALEEYNLLKKEPLQDKSAYNRALCLYETDHYQELLSLTKNLSSFPSLTLSQIQSIRYLCALSLQKSKDPYVEDDAISLFEGCKDTPFANHALVPLASLYLERKETHKAAECYVQLAATDAAQEASLLFEAALLEAPSDPSFALELFEKVLSLNSPYQTTCAYNALLLLHKMNNHEKAVEFYEKNTSLFSPNNEVEALSCVSNSLYSLEQWDKAISYLTLVLAKEPSMTNTLLLLSCAVHTNNPSLYEEVWDGMDLNALDAETKMQIHLTYLELASRSTFSSRFAVEAEKFLSSYPNHPKKKEVHLYWINSLYATAQMEPAHLAILSFLADYPQENTVHLLRLDLNCLSSLADDPSYRKKWIELSNSLSKIENFFSAEELEAHLSQLCHYLFLEDRFNDALDVAENFLAQFPSSHSLEEIHLIHTLCYLQDKDSHLLFAMQAEKFLDLYPENAQALSLHVHLFNTYLSQALNMQNELQNELLEKAASHLYIVFQSKNHSIQKENIQWLADHYYSLASQDSTTALLRAVNVLEALSQDATEEEAIYKLSKLFSMQGAFDKQISLLEGALTSTSSSLHKYFLFDLAKAYTQIGNTQKAVELYDKIILSSSHSIVGAQSVLEQSKLIFASIPPAEKKEENPTCQTLLDRLKDLENERSIATEPLHIEAGLEYIQCKCSLIEDAQSRKQKEEALLVLCKEKLSSAYDLSVSSKETDVIALYNRFLDLKIALYKASTQEEKESAAFALESLKNDNNTPSSLRAKIQTSLEGFSAL